MIMKDYKMSPNKHCEGKLNLEIEFPKFPN